MFLVDSYHNSTGKVILGEEHSNLFKLIDEKVELCQVHQTGQINKVDPVEVDNENENENENEHDTDEVDESLDLEIEVDNDDQNGHADDPTDVVKKIKTVDDVTTLKSKSHTNGHQNGHANKAMAKKIKS